MQPLDFHTLKTLYGEQIKQLATKHKLENVRVFGSVARGEANKDSDLDFLVHPRKDCSLFEFMDFEDDLAELFQDIDIDVVSDGSIHPRLAPIILAEALPL